MTYKLSESDLKATGFEIRLFSNCRSFKRPKDSRPATTFNRLLDRSKYSRDTAKDNPAVLWVIVLRVLFIVCNGGDANSGMG